MKITYSKNTACQFCGSTESIRKHGKSKIGIQRFWCLSCNKTYQRNYIYKTYDSYMQAIIKNLLSKGLESDGIAKALALPSGRVDKIIFSLDQNKK
ncbi:IS1 family transposase [Pragia fontium]|uniref:IS1 family transposase n=1 Tax=Pragia fontium TaxID=82985 RepID=UPI000F6C3965|nr:IS1 family transposase [Pragia fontium]VEJ55490.1 Transposase and inactivated derivatives [Pragia fontium]